MSNLREKMAKIIHAGSFYKPTPEVLDIIIDQLLSLPEFQEMEKIKRIWNEDCKMEGDNYGVLPICLIAVEGVSVERKCNDKDSLEDIMQRCNRNQKGCELKTIPNKGIKQCSGIFRRPATLQDVDIKDLINHYDYPCRKNSSPKTPDGGKLVVDETL
ncbi:MAG: hypothetical protein KKD44_25920 [Proteobacteria bacterium]|nr:hypothetical protein [Pseudomonadota bacterium]